MNAGDRARSTPWCVLAIVTLVAMMILRLLGPSDLYDQTQPKTIAYTTDIIVHGGTHWLLPIERGELPATKPPLFNWLAVPAVKWLGFNSEIAHKLPSIAAMLACWVILVRLGKRLDASGALGWLAALCFAANYAIFKLHYLARPDMLLTLWLLIAWICAMRVFSPLPLGEGLGVRAAARASSDSSPLSPQRSPEGRGSWPTVGFWLAVALAALTKGPVALVAVLFALLAARIIGGRFGAIRSLYPIIGLAFALAIAGAWVFAVWKIDPIHLREQLWFNEIYGRVTGTGAEGTRGGTRSFLKELPYQSFYFVTRFAPWSVLTVVAMLALWAPARWVKRLRFDSETNSTHDSQRAWMVGCAIFIVLTVGLFSLSVGKRADYVAVAIPQASLLAAWALLRVWPMLITRTPWLVPTAAALTLTFLSYYDHKQIWAPQPGFGNAIRDFINRSTEAIAADPGQVLNVSAGQSYMLAAFGITEGDQRRQVADIVARGEPFWVIAGRTQSPPHEFDLWMGQRRLRASAQATVRSPELPRDDGWPGQVTLWRVTPE